EVVAAALGPPGDALSAACAAAGADAVLALEHPALAVYGSEAASFAVAQAIEAYRPTVVLFSSTERGRDFAPRGAARLGLGLTGDAVGLEIDGERRLVAMKPAFGGHVVAPVLSRTTPAMATVRPGVLPRCVPTASRRARREALAITSMPAIRAQVTPHPARA